MISVNVKKAETRAAASASGVSQRTAAHAAGNIPAISATPLETSAQEARPASAESASAEQSDAFRVIEKGDGSADYRNLYHKPSINGIELNGNLSLGELDAQPSGDYVERDELTSLIDDIRQYECTIRTSNGTVFHNGSGSTELTASVLADGQDVSNKMSIIWKRGERRIGTGSSVVIDASTVTASDTVRFEAYDLLGTLRGFCEITLANVQDGDNGEDAALLIIDSSRGNMFKNNTVQTQLRVTVFYGGKSITGQEALEEAFGNAAHLEWYWQRLNEEDFHVISASDSRLHDNGFIFMLTPDDVDVKVTFQCQLII